MNIAALTGRFTSDPELKTTTSGVSVTTFTLAVDRKYQPQGEERKVDFIDFVAWRNTAELICKYFSKGSLIAVEGEIQTRLYEDKNGNKRKAVEIIVSNVSFCGSNSGNSSNNNSAEVEADSMGNTEFEEISAGLNQPLPF